jgi:hypothetical protein
MKVSHELFDSVGRAVDNADVAEAIMVLAYTLAQCGYQLSEGKFDPEVIQEIQFAVEHAYKHMCSNAPDIISIQ